MVDGMFSFIRMPIGNDFWQVWILITATAAICAAVLIKPNTARRQRENEPYEQFRFHTAPIGASSAVPALTLLAAFLVFYIAMILVWEDFTFYDDSYYTLNTLQGHNIPPQVSPWGARFFPLALQVWPRMGPQAAFRQSKSS
jgi:hypothetical protein